VAVEASLERAVPVFFLPPASKCDHNHPSTLLGFANTAYGVVAVKPRHADVDYRNIRVEGRRHVHGLQAIKDGPDLIAHWIPENRAGVLSAGGAAREGVAQVPRALLLKRKADRDGIRRKKSSAAETEAEAILCMAICCGRTSKRRLAPIRYTLPITA
jgi:hypothetical protein